MKKALIITAVALLIAGIALFTAALIAADFDFSSFGTGKYVTNTHNVDNAFSKIRIDTSTSDIVFKPSTDGKTSVVCYEREKVIHSVSVEGNTLIIKENDERKWIDYLTFFSKSASITLWIPTGEYESLEIEHSTGDISITDPYSFTVTEIKGSTGDMKLASCDLGDLKIKTSTGDVFIDGVKASKAEISASTGNVKADSLLCTGTIKAKQSTGKIDFSDVSCSDLELDGSTGKVLLKDFVASGSLSIKRSTGDVRFENSDAAEIKIKTSTGDVTGTLRSEKIFFTDTSTGSVSVPKTTSGGTCDIKTSTGDIEILISDGR